MKKLSLLSIFLFMTASISHAKTFHEQNEELFSIIKAEHSLSEAEMTKIRSIFKKSGYIGQGNPEITKHPMTRSECKAKLKKAGKKYENTTFEKICGDRFMAPLYNPATEKAENAKACIDQFEFPNIPCEYPVVWVRASEAVEICEAMGKRLCDAHEWEGGCQGELLPPDYDFSLIKKMNYNAAVKKMRYDHNAKNKASMKWSYGGKTYKKGICAANSTKSQGCNGGNWKMCGSNTYPVGSFPDCKSPLEVYDIHGNAAEHMNLPLKESQLSTSPTKEYGYTEMKGSWFIFDKYYAHKDWCRWRAPFGTVQKS